MNIGAELGQYFVQTHSKKSEDSMGYATGKKSLNCTRSHFTRTGCKQNRM